MKINKAHHITKKGVIKRNPKFKSFGPPKIDNYDKWKKVKTNFSNEDMWMHRSLGFINIIDDFNGSYHEYIVGSNNKDFKAEHGGESSVPFKTKKEAVSYANWWMKKLLE